MFTYFYSGGTHQPLQDTIESIITKNISKQIAVSAFIIPFKGIGATDWIWTNTPSKMITQRLAISCLTIRLTVAEGSFYA